MNEVMPKVVDGIPLCDEDCPSFDGKRCMLLGQRPDRICEPAVDDLRALAGQLAEALAMNGGTCSDCDHQICGRERAALDAARAAGVIK